MDIPTEENTKPQDPTPIQLEGSIEFKNLYFKYEDQGDWVLKNINFSIQPGESIALVGRTGCGKSTLISLLQNLYSVQQGDLFIDHKPIQSYNRSSLRNRIGVVLQNNFIFRGTISSNVTLDNLNISNEKLQKALHMANCNTLIKNRGEGYEAEVKAEGANLSTGEKQLIAMARALAFDPDILVLDEATSNIDSQTEALIQKSIEMATQNRTSIIIAHRLSTVKKCDRIVVLDRGEIIESGTHDELLSHRGLYYELIQSSKDTLE